jgi:hypothetical protein
MRCAVCGQSSSVEWFEFHGDEDASAPRTWTLCASCAHAVRHELRRTRLRSPERVRVAIAMVASERADAVPSARSVEREGDRVERLLIGTVLAAFLVHALAFVLVIAFIAASH